MDKWTYCAVNLSASRRKLQFVPVSLPFPRLGVGVLLLCLESVSCFCVDTGGAVETWCYHLLLGELLKKTMKCSRFFLKCSPKTQILAVPGLYYSLMLKGRVQTNVSCCLCWKDPSSYCQSASSTATLRILFLSHLSGKSQQNPHTQ